MPAPIQPPTSIRAKERQLALPFAEPVSSLPATLPVVETIRPPGLWLSLSATARTRVRLTMLRVAQEVLRDARRS